MTEDNKIVEKLQRDIENLRQELANLKTLYEEGEFSVKAAQVREQRLLEVTQVLNNSSDLQSVLENVLGLTVDLLRADAGTMDIITAPGEQTFYPISFHLPETLLLLRYRPKGEDLSWEDIESGQSMIIEDYPADPKARQELVDANVHGVIGVPVKAGKICLGSMVIYLLTPEDTFNEYDLAVAESIAIQIGTAIQNAFLFKDVQQLTNVDPLTNLYTPHHFFDVAEHDLERVYRYGSYTSVIMLEIDNMTQLQQQCGEEITNQVLEKVANFCREKLRTSDILGRYSRGRLVFLLPEADIDKAKLTAERVCKQIGSAPIETDIGPIPITASLGVAATKRGRKIGAKKLINRAEQVLAAAISSGRNRVAIWNPEPEEY